MKYWSSAGIMLTYWCNAQCGSCYLQCSPERHEWMDADEAVNIWRGLQTASPHGCKIHLTGGEPFGNWDLLIDVCRRARVEGLGPLDKVETNAFWATDRGVVADRINALADAGMKTFGISADPYHQQYVPIDRCRLAAEVAEGILGPERVQVRWRDWLLDGFDTSKKEPAELNRLFAQYLCGTDSYGRERLNGRAAGCLSGLMSCKSLKELSSEVDTICREPLLRSKHVHVGPGGWVLPGVCSGILLGCCGKSGDIGKVWQDLGDNWAKRPIVGTLAAKGSLGLAELACENGFVPESGYASGCHLCWDARMWLAKTGRFADELGPGWMYGL